VRKLRIAKEKLRQLDEEDPGMEAKDELQVCSIA
jgi:hypothetical protein